MLKNSSITTGLSFGLASGVITTLGLLVGLEASTGSRAIILAGILTIAVADALSDALGMHIAEEAHDNHSRQAVWQATIATLLAKFFFAVSFVVPVLLLSPPIAVMVSIIWGLFLITSLTCYMSRKQNKSPWKPIAEHLTISVFVIIITHYIGHWAGRI